MTPWCNHSMGVVVFFFFSGIEFKQHPPLRFIVVRVSFERLLETKKKRKKKCHYCLPGIFEERQHNETTISSQMNFLIIINHSKEYKDFWAFFKHFNNKENIFPLGCTNQMNSTQIDTNNNGGDFL